MNNTKGVYVHVFVSNVDEIIPLLPTSQILANFRISSTQSTKTNEIDVNDTNTSNLSHKSLMTNGMAQDEHRSMLNANTYYEKMSYNNDIEGISVIVDEEGKDGKKVNHIIIYFRYCFIIFIMIILLLSYC